MLGHPSRPLRHTAGTCAVTIVNLTGLGAWPELVAALAEGLDAADDSNRVEGALDLVYKVGWRRPGACTHRRWGPAVDSRRGGDGAWAGAGAC